MIKNGFRSQPRNGLGKEEDIADALASVRERAAAFDQFAAKNKITVPGPTVVTSHGANLMKINEMKQLVSFAKSPDAFGKHHDGKIDILVNNAGIQHVAPIDDFTSKAWDPKP